MKLYQNDGCISNGFSLLIIAPLGSTVYVQTLALATKKRGELDVEQLGPVAFVPMVGEMEKKR